MTNKDLLGKDVLNHTAFIYRAQPNRCRDVLDKLEACDPNRMTPIESLMLVSELKKLVD